MPFTVHTIPEGQREVERLEKLVQEQQETIAAMSQKQLLDAEYHKRESAIDIAKIHNMRSFIIELKNLISNAYELAEPGVKIKMMEQIKYLDQKYPEL